MTPGELQLGDIIFTHREFGIYTHVAMYTGYDIDGKQQITHSVTNNWPGLQTTVLVDQSPMHVFRPSNKLLGEKAANRMLDWVKYHIPYDTRRAKWMDEINNNISPGKQVTYLKNEATNKFYERIKFAARRDTCPIKISANQESRGFTCVQAAILAYQIEEIAPYVKPLASIRKELEPLATTEEELNEVWISDKHCPKEIMDTYILPDSYISYFMALRDQEEFTDFCINDKRKTPTHPHYYPSLVAWRYDLQPSIDKFRENFTSCLELPAKISTTGGLFSYMQMRNDVWLNLGTLDKNTLPNKNSFTETEKKLHRARSSDLSEYVEACRTNIIRERTLSSTSSPRLSPNNSFYGLGNGSMLEVQLQMIGASASASATASDTNREESRAGMVSPLLGTLYPRV